MTEQARIATLAHHHAALELRIVQEQRRPCPDWLMITRLKRERLRVKEEIERLRAQLARWRGATTKTGGGYGAAGAQVSAP